MTKFYLEPNRKRDNEPHEFAVFLRGEIDPDKREILLALYKETCQSWRTLLDIRFKLLAIVPTVSFVSIAGLLSPGGWLVTVHGVIRIALASLGFTVTLSLFLYELRNSELYTDLGSRARRMEYELGVHTGQFLGRLNPQNQWVDHNRAINIVYFSALLGWLVTVIGIVLYGSFAGVKL